MTGIIVKIDIDDNGGIVLDENKKQYHFYLEDCVGFESYPQLKEKVDFGLNDGEVYFLEPHPSNKKTALKSDDKKIYHDISYSKKQTVQLAVSVNLNKSIDDCLDNYFEDVISVVYNYEAEFQEDQTLNFLLMKRFLDTAYNNLKDMDSTFMDEYLLELRNDIKTIEKVYSKFHKKYKSDDIAFETVFLEQQSSYQQFKTRLKTNSSEMISLKLAEDSLERQIEILKQEINKSSNAENKISKENDLKRYNTYFVDNIHRLANLKDENIQIKSELDNFEKRYKDEFLEVYNEEAEKYNKFIIEQLDGYAYEFDKVMWEQAETSSSIRQFFKRANIEDDYSSKTFLKYFIKSLDSTKFSAEHKKLYNLLEYLDSRAKMRILIVTEDIGTGETVKHIIRSFDKEYSVEKNDKPRSTYYRKDLKRLDLIFVDQGMKNPLVSEYIDMMQKRLQQSRSKAILCLTSPTFTKADIVNFKEKGINYFLATNLGEYELHNNLKEIVQNIHG